MLGMDIPHLNRGHIVAVDEFGVVDPADNAPDHVPLDVYVRNRLQDAVVFHTEWLAVRNLRAEQIDRESAKPLEGANGSL